MLDTNSSIFLAVFAFLLPGFFIDSVSIEGLEEHWHCFLEPGISRVSHSG